MGWQLFETGAEAYEAWYASQRGRRVDRAERELLGRLLRKMPGTSSLLEVGCGTGHFTSWFAERGVFAIGLDRAPAMLTTLRRLHPCLPAVQGDAYKLPVRDEATDVTALIATLEFLEEPEAALAEAVRVARRGLILVVLNAWSVGGISRRWGEQARARILGKARDYSLPGIIDLVRAAASDRIRKLFWTGALYPVAPAHFLARIPFGDVIGLSVTLRPRPESSRSEDRAGA